MKNFLTGYKPTFDLENRIRIFFLIEQWQTY